MDNTITYLNTDLDLNSVIDLEPLVKVFKSSGILALHVSKGDDGIWRARFETDEQFPEPEPNIAAFLGLVDALSVETRAIWDQCTLREFNIGYDCGDEPWAFSQTLSPELLGRVAAVRASLALTLYPDREPKRTAK